MACSRTLVVKGALLLTLSPALVSCGASASVVRAELVISASGEYTLDGSAVAEPELKHQLRAKRPASGELQLSFIVSPQASFESVGRAMQAAQYAGAKVGIVGNVSSK